MPPQLEKNHVVPTAWEDEALARDGKTGLTNIKMGFFPLRSGDPSTGGTAAGSKQPMELQFLY